MKEYFTQGTLAEKAYRLALLLVVVSLFLPIKFNSLAIALLGMSWIASRPWAAFRSRLMDNKVALLFIGLYLMHGIGLLWTSNMGYGGKEMEYKLSFILFPLFIATGPRLSLPQLKIVGRTFYLSTLALLGVGSAMAVSAVNSGAQDSLMSAFTYRAFSEPMGFDPIYLAMYVVFAIFCLVQDRSWVDHSDSLRRPGLLDVVGLLILFSALIFLSSRMEILVFYCCAAFACVVYAFLKRTYLKPVLLMLGLLAGGYLLIGVNSTNKERFSEAVDLEADYTENKWGGRSVRIEKWKNAIECWSASPFIGVGTGDTIDALVEVYERNEFDIAVFYRFNPHNQYLQLAVALGLIGLFFLLAIFAVMSWRAWRYHDIFLMLFVLLVSLSMLTESLLERQKGVVFITFFAMLLFTHSRGQRALQD